MTARHSVLGGKVQVFRRPQSPLWQCSASVGGHQYRASTKQAGLAQAKDFAEDWYLTLQGKHRFGGGIESKPKRSGKTFQEAGEAFTREYEAITLGERNPKYVKGHSDRLRVHLNPFFGDKLVTEITPGLVQEYRLPVSRRRTRTRIAPRVQGAVLSARHASDSALEIYSSKDYTMTVPAECAS